jgi:hypothetical protein
MFAYIPSPRATTTSKARGGCRRVGGVGGYSILWLPAFSAALDFEQGWLQFCLPFDFKGKSRNKAKKGEREENRKTADTTDTTDTRLELCWTKNH